MVLLVGGLVERAPEASAANQARQGSLTSNPFAVGDAASFSADPSTSPAPPTRYEGAVVADKPTLYLPLTETGGTTAFDHSGNGLDGTYAPSVTHEGPGPLLDEPNVAVFGSGEVVSQSGDALPSASASRTLEIWVHNTAAAYDPIRYGDVEHGHGFAVHIGADHITVEASGHEVTAAAIDGLGHGGSIGACCDTTGWHMVDVTYDGSTVEIYQDGQLIGGGALGEAETNLPGQGLRLEASSEEVTCPYGACEHAGAPPYGIGEAAVYPTALSPEAIAAHWSAGASSHEEATCSSTPTGAYPKAVLEDSPVAYYRMGDRAVYPNDRVAFDASGHCANGTYDIGTSAGVGALQGDETSALYGGGQEIFQSGDTLPSGSTQRTLEIWVHNTAAAYDPIRYGDFEHGHGFAVHIGADHITVEASGHEVTAAAIDGLGHGGSIGACCDTTGWHMVDVTYDGTAVEIYEDGQLIGGGALGEAETNLPGQGLRLEASSEETTCPYGACEHASATPYGISEAAIYRSTLTSRQIVTHWEAASQAPAGSSVIAGSAVINGDGGAEGARVQACPTSGGACKVDPYPVDAQGFFHMVVPNGAYTITIFPPAGTPDGTRTIGPLTLPPSVLNVTETYSPPGGLPEGVSLSSGGQKQEEVVPAISWGEPSVLTVPGCKGGFGAAYLEGTNASTGASESRAAALNESPLGSGTYEAHLPPPVPIHGLASIYHGFVCPDRKHLFPDGGSSGGGTSVLLTGSGFTGATQVSFGSTPAISFKVLQDDAIEAVSPSGNGTASITVTSADGKAISAGSFSYFGVTSLDTTSGTAEGGTTVAIHGYGFDDVKNVAFGVIPATSFKVVSPTEVDALAPPGVGTVDVQVVNDAALSDPVSADYFRYSGGPPDLSSLIEGTGPDAPLSFAARVSGVIESSGGSAGLPGDGPRFERGALCAAAVGLSISGLGVLGWGGVALGVATGIAPIAVAGAIFAVADTLICLSALNGNDGNLKIDPSGTIVDTYGNPVASATATLLEQPLAVDPLKPVEPSSGAIEPAENPETTGPSGQFDWNALAGIYEVEASAPGCHAPGQESQPNVFTSPFVLPPPAVGLTLTLECLGGTAPTPTVTGLSASRGTTAGGNVVDILGEGLANVTSVHFGGNASVHAQSLSPYALAAIAPAGSGTVSVTVSGPGGTSATAEGDHYTYSTPVLTANSPVVETVGPNNGPLSGGTVVTIKGTHLGGTFSVEFGGTTSTQVTPISGNEVQVVAPAAAFPERVDVTVTTASGDSAPALADSFTYGSPAPPVATSMTLTPSLDPATAGQTVGLTAAVAPTDGGGTVAFYADGSSTAISGCGAQTLSQAGASYQATCSTTGLAVGSHTISATYSGDASYAESSGSTGLSVTSVPKSTGGGATTGGGNPNPQIETETKTVTSTAASGIVSLAGSTISVQRSGAAAIKLTCTGTSTCSGKLTLTARRTTKKGKKKRTGTRTIGTTTFSISAGDTATARIALNAIGRDLLSAAHGHLNATLTILKSSPSPAVTQTASVHLALQKATKTKQGKP